MQGIVSVDVANCETVRNDLAPNLSVVFPSDNGEEFEMIVSDPYEATRKYLSVQYSDEREIHSFLIHLLPRG